MKSFRKMTIGCVLCLCSALIFSACGGDSSDDTSSDAAINAEAENEVENINNNENTETGPADANTSSGTENNQPSGGGGRAPFSFSSTLENQKLELTITQNYPIRDEYGNEYQNFAASMYFADDAGNLLKLSGGECQTFEKDKKYVMTVEFESDANFVYAALRAQVYHGSECELIQLNDTYTIFLFKNNEGNVRIIDVNEYYAHSASQEGN